MTCIEQNPVKIGLPVQQWSFVKEYDGWPLHPGHNPNSALCKKAPAVASPFVREAASGWF